MVQTGLSCSCLAVGVGTLDLPRYSETPHKGLKFVDDPSYLCFKAGCAVFRWLWRQRIRLHLEGTGINPTPVDLHELQLSLEQHSQAHRITTLGLQQRMSPAP